MKLYEYEAKNIFARSMLPVPRGKVARTPGEALRIASELGGRVALKAQVLAAGRGKAGGVKFAANAAEAELEAGRLLGATLLGRRIQSLLVEERLEIARELYLSVTVDRGSRSYMLLASSEGGVDIEELALRAPEKIVRHRVEPPFTLQDYEARWIARGMGSPSSKLNILASIISRLFKVAWETDAELVEINPLVELVDGRLVAADAKIIIDDNALFRHSEFKERLGEVGEEQTQWEVEASKHDLAYVDLEGDVGIIGNGAGLVMATLDLVQLNGGRPANFLEVGGGASSEVVEAGLRIIVSKPAVKVALINILGGITRCDDVAVGIVKALGAAPSRKPLVVRMIGTREEEGRKILREAGIEVLDSMEEGARRAVELAGGRG